MKRITILPLVFALALVSLAACGGDGPAQRIRNFAEVVSTALRR